MTITFFFQFFIKVFSTPQFGGGALSSAMFYGQEDTVKMVNDGDKIDQRGLYHAEFNKLGTKVRHFSSDWQTSIYSILSLKGPGD